MGGNRRSSRTLAALLAFAWMTSVASPSDAAPFRLGDQVCGDLVKKRMNDGSVVWEVAGCPQLERLAACGNGVLEPGEACDRAIADSCSRGRVCVACEACVKHAPEPTPSPTPMPTPTPTPGCPQGELPEFPGLFGVVGYAEVAIGDGATHGYCVTLSEAVSSLRLDVYDRTGAEQCSWFQVTVSPPAGSGRPEFQGEGRHVSYTAPSWPTPLSPGTWRISVTAEALGGGCQQRYGVAVQTR